ncbi:MAG: hypothetical protein KC561_20645, partial [Myxococcales bacterium]|nr:hypothetical protein [Myxococcales bacterium]
ELDQRFGLHFEIYSRDFVSARRRERGWGINPWTTHPHFIVSLNLLRGTRGNTRHYESLLSSLSGRDGRTLLILDEAHHAAPATGSAYAIDSRTTRAIREVAKKFEHRLFLSATPHNGHSNSFSALLELLDPQRFTRGVPVKSVKELAPVVVRRLKAHLRKEVGGLPERVLVDHEVPLGKESPEVRLGELLSRYEIEYNALLEGLPMRERLARGLVCVSLHKRLLSSIAAFARTLRKHRSAAERRIESLEEQPQQAFLPVVPSRDLDSENLEDDVSDDQLDEQDDQFVEANTVRPGSQALAILQEMSAIAEANRERPDARLEALAKWIQANLLTANNEWNHRRVVVFTEYLDTLQWLARHLPSLLS